MTYIEIKNFKKSSAQKHNMNKPYSTSKESSIYSLEKDFQGYNAKSLWLVKNNQFDWIVSEYAAAKLYQMALGADLVSDVILLKTKSGISIATKLRQDYLKTMHPFGIDKKADQYRIKDINNFKSDNYIYGFEKAFVTSRLFNEADDNDLMNYAVINLGDNNVMTRYDFDDSFKFFLYEGITQGMLEESLNIKVKNSFKVQGISVEALLERVNSLNDKVEFNWNDFKESSGGMEIFYSMKPNNFLKAFDDLLKLDTNKIMESIKQSFAEISEVTGEEIFAKYYNLEKLDNLEASSNSQNLANYAISQVMKNFLKMEPMRDCLEVEIFAENKDVKHIAEISERDSYNPNVECESYYNGNTFTIGEVVESFLGREI